MLALLPLGAVKLPAWFSDNMVLQQTDTETSRRATRPRRAARDSEHATAGGSYSVTGRRWSWKATLDPQHATGKPFSITISGADGPSVTANNVLAGDVFFCSGQSNMVYPLHLAFNATAEAATISNHPNFRFFMTERRTSPTPLFDFSGNGTCDSSYVNKSLSACNRWLTAAEAAGDYVEAFSAVCYMTVRDIAKLHTGDRPIALIQSAWGGTRVEAWRAAADIAAAGAPVTGNVPHGSGPNEQSVLYNAMVAPWDPFSIRAMLWYQGEANANELTNHNQSISYYANAYQAMIAGWRERKGRLRRGEVQLLGQLVDGGVQPHHRPPGDPNRRNGGGGARRRRHRQLGSASPWTSAARRLGRRPSPNKNESAAARAAGSLRHIRLRRGRTAGRCSRRQR